MSKKQRLKTAALGSLGWGIGWGLARGLMTAYSRSVAQGFFLQSVEFYTRYYSKMTAYFILGMLIATLATALMLWKSTPGFRFGHAAALIASGVIPAAPMGFILVFISQYALPAEQLFLIWLGFYFCIAPLVMGLLGSVIGLLSARTARRANPALRETRLIVIAAKWALALTLGGVIASLPSWFFGLVGGFVAGMIANGALIPGVESPHQGETLSPSM